jgi:hypothetical protein
MDRPIRAQISTQISTSRTAEAERRWLSTLVGAMEQASERASQSDDGARVCKRAELARLRAQLACPASPYPFGASAYSLRN